MSVREELTGEIRRLAGEAVTISDETEIRYGLKIEGDDLEQLLAWIQDRYAVDFSALDARDFNLNEPPALVREAFGRRRFKSMTVGALLRAIETKRWTAV